MAICAKPFSYFLCKLFGTNNIHDIKIKVRLILPRFFYVRMKLSKTANFLK
ncbi:20071_t:CDS:1, partial [Rhizophagus irregularis]